MTKGEKMKKFISVFFVGLFLVLFASSDALAENASWTSATTYTGGTPKESDDVFSTRIYEGMTLICENSGSSCTFTVAQCSGSHTYIGRTYSSKYRTESADSNVANYVSTCIRTPSQPQLLKITIN